MVKKKTVKRKRSAPQTVVRLNDKQREALEKLCALEDLSISDVLKLGLKTLCQQHGVEWPLSRI